MDDFWMLTGKSGQSLVGSLLLSPGSWCTHASVCALQESVSPVLCTFWRLYGGVNAALLQKGLCHTQVCCIRSPCPCSSPLLTCSSTADPQTQFWLSLCGVSGSWCAQGLFEPSECLWQVWGLILNVIWRLLPSCWVFSFALEVSFLVGSNILLLMTVHLRGVILEFSQEKISKRHSTPPWSCRCNYQVHNMKQFLCDCSNIIWITSHSRFLHLKTISSGFSPRTVLRTQGQDNLLL